MRTPAPICWLRGQDHLRGPFAVVGQGQGRAHTQILRTHGPLPRASAAPNASSISTGAAATATPNARCSPRKVRPRTPRRSSKWGVRTEPARPRSGPEGGSLETLPVASAAPEVGPGPSTAAAGMGRSAARPSSAGSPGRTPPSPPAPPARTAPQRGGAPSPRPAAPCRSVGSQTPAPAARHCCPSPSSVGCGPTSTNTVAPRACSVSQRPPGTAPAAARAPPSTPPSISSGPQRPPRHVRDQRAPAGAPYRSPAATVSKRRSIGSISGE